MLDSPTTMLNDPARLAALDVLDLLDTPAEEAFDRVTRIATRLLSVPVALVTFVDTNRQFFKSSIGLPEPWPSQRETPLSHSFCQYIVGSGEPMLVTDARLHPHLKDNLAIPDLGVVAYAGVPLRSADGQVLGALCAIEGSPRTWSDDDLATLHDLAEVVMLVMHQRRRAAVVVERWAEADTAQREKDALLDRVSDAFYALDRSWRFVHLNVHCDKLLQRSREELIGRCIWDEFPEATDSPLYLEFHHALDSGIASEFDFYYPPLDTWFEVRVHPADEGLSVYFRDVSERRQHEAALRYLHEVVDASNDAIIGTDDARRITNWNDAATRIYRKTADEVLGQSASILIPGEYDATATEIREAIQSGRTIGDIEMRLSHDDGSVVDVSITIAPVFDAGGGDRGLVRNRARYHRTSTYARSAARRRRTLPHAH